MRLRRKLSGWLLTVAMGFALASNALACAFHGYSPKLTAVDVVLATEQVAFARIDPQNADSYIVIKTLLGPTLTSLPISPDPAFRDVLVEDQSRVALVARAGSYGPWTEVDVLDTRYQSVITEVAARQSEWLWGAEKLRLDYFAKRINDESPLVRRLALHELDRAPYSDLRKLRLPKYRDLASDLKSSDKALRPIRILLAGLSGDKAFTPILSKGLMGAIAQEQPYTGAYATALIELEGKNAVETIIALLPESRGHSMVTRERLLEALAIQHKSAPRTVRRTISKEVAKLLRQSPELKDAAAIQFGYRSR